jgi:hypothetical protein
MVETKKLGAVLKKERVLDVVYHSEHGTEVASFSGDDLAEWERTLNEIASGKLLAPMGERETCPHCGREGQANELLERGCDYCGWVSPKLKRQLKRSALDGAAR